MTDPLVSVKRIWDEIDDLRRQIAAAEKRVNRELRRLSRNKHRDSVLAELYWEAEERVQLSRLAKLFRLELRDLAAAAGPLEVETTCLSCGKEFTAVVSSKTAHKELLAEEGANPKHRLCPPCEKMREYHLERLRKKGKRPTAADRARYRDYLASDQWQERRQTALARAKFKCQLCSAKLSLNVHHRTYKRIGREKPEDLIVLCRRCHEHHHDH